MLTVKEQVQSLVEQPDHLVTVKQFSGQKLMVQFHTVCSTFEGIVFVKRSMSVQNKWQVSDCGWQTIFTWAKNTNSATFSQIKPDDQS